MDTEERDAGDSTEAKGPPAAELLVQLALQEYELGVTPEGNAFAVRKGGAAVALMFKGSVSSLKAELIRTYRKEYDRPPNQTAVADALACLEAEAAILVPRPVHLRVAETEDGRIIVDLGDATGRAVEVRTDGWSMLDKSPVLFHRTRLTAALPTPEHDGDLGVLRELLNVTDETWPRLIPWLIAGFIPEIAHPILLLGGEQGTGKSTLARLLVGLLDPSSVPLRTRPSNERGWCISAAGSWCVAVDNVSVIPEWWSDSLCKAVTGDGWVDRKLFTDSDLTVLSFRRVVLITSIASGALRGDLGDRLVLVDLERISSQDRLSEIDLLKKFDLERPRILGALLDLLSGVLWELPFVDLAEMPRMADYCRVVAAVDRVTGGDALGAFLGQRERIAAEVVSNDPLGSAILKLMVGRTIWEGSATELFEKTRPPRLLDVPGYPKGAAALGQAFQRLAPALREIGIEAESRRKSGGSRDRVISLRKRPPDDEGVEDSVPAVPADPETPEGAPRGTAGDGRDGESSTTASSPGDEDGEWPF